MPLHQGYGRQTISKNIELMMHEGYPQPQAVAASLENARKSWRQRHPRGPYPGHLSGRSSSNRVDAVSGHPYEFRLMGVSWGAESDAVMRVLPNGVGGYIDGKGDLVLFSDSAAKLANGVKLARREVREVRKVMHKGRFSGGYRR